MQQPAKNLANWEGQCGWKSELCLSVAEEEIEDDASVTS
jgi:hypothetical protein